MTFIQLKQTLFFWEQTVETPTHEYFLFHIHNGEQRHPPRMRITQILRYRSVCKIGDQPSPSLFHLQCFFEGITSAHIPKTSFSAFKSTNVSFFVRQSASWAFVSDQSTIFIVFSERLAVTQTNAGAFSSVDPVGSSEQRVARKIELSVPSDMERVSAARVLRTTRLILLDCQQRGENGLLNVILVVW